MPRKSAPRRVVIVRYHLSDGTRCRKSDTGAIRTVTESEVYYARIQRKWVPLHTTDLGQAWVELRRLQRRAKDREVGLIDDYQEQAARPLAEHVREWLQSVRDKGTTQEQVDTLQAHVEYVAGLAGWKRVADLTADSCLRALTQLQEIEGLSPQTRNHYAKHCKQFARWCARTRPRRLPEDPLDAVEMVGVETDRRHDRRPPTDEEIALLFEHLNGEAAPARRHMTGPQRSMGYRVCMATGFRAAELRSLSRKSFDLKEGVVTCRAAYDKRRRRVTQQLPTWLAGELQAWFDSGGGCWEQFPATYPGRLLKADLAAARAAWIAEVKGSPDEQARREKSDTLRYEIEGPDGPLFLDFHSLRHWYCTFMANLPGISPRTLMALCRHSTPTLTLKTYAKARLNDLREAVGQMPEPPRERPEPPPSSRPKPSAD